MASLLGMNNHADDRRELGAKYVGAMNGVRRIAVIVLLLALAPALGLAGMPLKYCKSATGHQAVEMVFGLAHGGNDVSHRVATGASSVDDCGQLIPSAREINCTDADLVELGQIPSAEQPITAPAPVIAAPVSIPPVADIARRLVSCIEPAPRIDPRMAARHSVVLRI